MKPKPLPLLATVLMTSCLLLKGCGGEPPAEAAAMVHDKPAMTLENTDWILVELNGEAIASAPPLKAPSLRLDGETGLAAGNSGVNQYGGNYTVKGDSIEFGPMRSTMMAGPPEAMDLEQAFMAALGGQTGWRIADGRLELSAGDRVTAVFVVAPGKAMAMVSGTVFYREKMLLGPAAVLEVFLEDVSLADAPATRIATYRKENPGSPPFSFGLDYDPGAIDERHTYGVRARITIGDKLRFASDTMYPVITRDHGKEVEILVKGVGSAE